MYSVVSMLYFFRPCPDLGVDSKYRIVSLLSLINLLSSVIIKFNLSLISSLLTVIFALLKSVTGILA